jgi:hypothetical protein
MEYIYFLHLIILFVACRKQELYEVKHHGPQLDRSAMYEHL